MMVIPSFIQTREATEGESLYVLVQYWVRSQTLYLGILLTTAKRRIQYRDVCFYSVVGNIQPLVLSPSVKM